MKLIATILLLPGLVAAQLGCQFCKLEKDQTMIDELGMMPTPLPGNFFTLEKFDDAIITQNPYASEAWFQTFVASSSFPAMVRVQSLRQAGVQEVLHFLPGNAVWSYNGGCPSKFLVIHRDWTYQWYDIGPDIEEGHVLSVFIGAGEYYAHLNGVGSAFMTSTISPGINGGMDIVTPTFTDILSDLFVNQVDHSDLYALIQEHGTPDP